jgi:hypothetical protein
MCISHLQHVAGRHGCASRAKLGRLARLDAVHLAHNLSVLRWVQSSEKCLFIETSIWNEP